MKKLAVLILLIASPALAQQQPPDPAFLQRALGAMQAQRNQAMDSAAVSEAKLAEALARIKTLEASAPKEEPKKD